MARHNWGSSGHVRKWSLNNMDISFHDLQSIGPDTEILSRPSQPE